MQDLPALVVATPQRTVVRPTGPADTIGDLASALGADATTLSVGGQVHPPSTPLVAIRALRHGAAVERVVASEPAAASEPVAVRPDGEPADSAPAVQSVVERAIDIAIVLGPDCRPWRPLAPGRHIVGRAGDAHVVIADPTVEPYHALLTVHADDEAGTDRSQTGSPSMWGFRQLTGGVDVDERTTSDHHLSASAAPHHRHADVDTSITLYRMGASTLAIRRARGPS